MILLAVSRPRLWSTWWLNGYQMWKLRQFVRQSYLETKALVNPLGDSLAVVEADSFADTPGDVEAKALLNACPIVQLR